MAKVADIIAKAKAKPDDEAEDGGVDFDIPQGFNVPDGTEPGDEFTAVGTFELDEDQPGKMVLTKVDGIPLGGSEGPEESTEAPAPPPGPPATPGPGL